MKEITYQTSGTCSQYIYIQADDNKIIQHVKVLGGCSGNLQGISKLLYGMHFDEVKKRLSGIQCGIKGTSCPDQIAKAIEEFEKQY